LGNYGNVCLNLKKYEEAIISYSLALKAGAPNDFFYNNRAFAEIKLRRFDDAIISYN
jgi:tetratricopeptide (TPR) repeat protein